MDFGDKLLYILNERDITQREFAALLNIAPTTLNGYIKNKRQPDFALVRQIAFSLGVSIDYLLDYNSASQPSLEELSLISKLRKMSERDRSIVRDLIDLIDTRTDK